MIKKSEIYRILEKLWEFVLESLSKIHIPNLDQRDSFFFGKEWGRLCAPSSVGGQGWSMIMGREEQMEGVKVSRGNDDLWFFVI